MFSFVVFEGTIPFFWFAFLEYAFKKCSVVVSDLALVLQQATHPFAGVDGAGFVIFVCTVTCVRFVLLELADEKCFVIVGELTTTFEEVHYEFSFVAPLIRFYVNSLSMHLAFIVHFSFKGVAI